MEFDSEARRISRGKDLSWSNVRPWENFTVFGVSSVSLIGSKGIAEAVRDPQKPRTLCIERRSEHLVVCDLVEDSIDIDLTPDNPLLRQRLVSR